MAQRALHAPMVRSALLFLLALLLGLVGVLRTAPVPESAWSSAGKLKTL